MSPPDARPAPAGTSVSSRSQTLATWLALLGGSLGLDRFYLHGWSDRLGWLLWLPTLLGLYGVARMQELGQDDRLASLLIPLLGVVLAATMLKAILHGLMDAEKWNARFSPAGAGYSVPWLNVVGAILALALGATVLMATTAFTAQRFFEHRAQQRAEAD